MNVHLRALIVLAIVGSGCARETTKIGAGAAHVTVSWKDFSPGCLRLGAWDDATGRGIPIYAEIPLQKTSRSGEREFDFARPLKWDEDVTIRAEALEGGCTKSQVVSRAEKKVALRSGKVELDLALTATDADGDGFVSATAELPGTDCDDSRADIAPGREEVLDGVDNNCNGKIDENILLLTWCQDPDDDGKTCVPRAGDVQHPRSTSAGVHVRRHGHRSEGRTPRH
jgi:hypothetical protein